MKGPDVNRGDRGDQMAALRRQVEELAAEVAVLRKDEEKYRLIADHSGDCLWVMDLATLRFTYVSPAVTRIYGSTVEETLEQSVSDVLPPESLALVMKILEEELALEATGKADPNRMRTIEVEEYRKDRSRVWIENVLSFMRDEDQRPAAIVGVSRDVTKRRLLEQELRNLAITDPLTGAYNRRHFLEELQQEMDRSDRYSHPFALIMFDIDHFKEVNDRFGHEAGDRVLRELAEMVRKRVRSTDLLARWGGEEFMILLPNTTLPPAATLAQDLLKQMQEGAFSEIGRITASFGVAVHRPGEGIDALLTRVDDLMYQAKRKGRSRLACDPDPPAAT
ncbi:MAG: sensor domain-containing diguanylate cyclase [Deltaproteobacteria bacterium]|nr:sensor domain-containing diguanylate cyclase [Deltaproteobacteria bacterium]